MADSAIASSLLVVLPIADTTTMGWRPTRALTIPATRSMAEADSTDDPPNFITIMFGAFGTPGGRPAAGQKACPTTLKSQQTFRMHQLGIQNRRSSRSPNGVVAE